MTHDTRHLSSEKLALYRQLADEGYSQTVTAEIMGVSRQRVCQIANKYGIEFLTGKCNHDLRARIEELHAEGMTIPQIAEATGVPYLAALNNTKAMGLLPNKAPKRSKYEAAIRDMAARGMTVRDVARAISIRENEVSRIKAKFGIPFHTDGRSRRTA